jgi:hypothetical protein
MTSLFRPAADNDPFPVTAKAGPMENPLGSLVAPSLGLVAPFTAETVMCRCDDDMLYPSITCVADSAGRRVIRTYSEIVGTFVTVLVSPFDRATTRALAFALAAGSQATITRMIEEPDARETIARGLFEDEIFICALNRSDQPAEVVQGAINGIFAERDAALIRSARRTRILRLRERIEANELRLNPHPAGDNVVLFRRR